MINKRAENRLAEVERLLKKNKPLLKERFKVKEIGIFGSFLRGEQKKTSDLDLLVEFIEPVGLFDFIRLEDYLTSLLGIKVDLIMKSALKPRLKDKVIKEALYI